MQEVKVDSRYIREWKRESNKGNIVIIHGVGEHSKRYIHAAEHLFEHGYNVFTGDLTGHGMSDGIRVYVNSIQDYHKDVDFLLGRIDNDKPVFLLGHSMGGLVVLDYMGKTSRKDIQGVIASSPYIKDKMKIPGIKYLLGKLAAKLIPKLRIESGLTGEMVCRDKGIAALYNEDKLNCSKVTAKWFIEMEKARNGLMQRAEDFTSPCLILQAGSDVVVDPEGVRAFYQQISARDKTFIQYDDFYHEILNDPNREEVFLDILQWLDARI